MRKWTLLCLLLLMNGTAAGCNLEIVSDGGDKFVPFPERLARFIEEFGVMLEVTPKMKPSDKEIVSLLAMARKTLENDRSSNSALERLASSAYYRGLIAEREDPANSGAVRANADRDARTAYRIISDKYNNLDAEIARTLLGRKLFQEAAKFLESETDKAGFGSIRRFLFSPGYAQLISTKLDAFASLIADESTSNEVLFLNILWFGKLLRNFRPADSMQVWFASQTDPNYRRMTRLLNQAYEKIGERA